jgi:dTDP-4-dehydrorhamnose reductase
MLARDMVKSRPADVVLAALTRQELDIRDSGALDLAIERNQAQWVFNCAGLTNVDLAETDRDAAFAVNAVAVESMAGLCGTHGAKLLHFSTDYIFDGKNSGFYSEEDVPNPLNTYGESKLAGELAVQRSGAPHLIIRTQWLFGTAGRSFVGLMCERAISKQRTRVVADEAGCCTYTVDLAAAAWELVQSTTGVVHVANRGKVSRYDLAARIFERFQALSLLEPCSAKEFGSTTRRPVNSALSVRRAERILGRAMPNWEDALDRYLIERDLHHIPDGLIHGGRAR